MWVSTAQAAEILGISGRQVRRLVEAGRVRELTRGVLVESDVREELARRDGVAQRRPLDHDTAWAAIDLLSGGPGSILATRQLARLKQRLRTTSVEELITMTRARAVTWTFGCHRPDASFADGIVVRLAARDATRSSSGFPVEGYVHPDRVELLRSRGQLAPGGIGQRVTIHVTPTSPAFIRVLLGSGSVLQSLEQASQSRRHGSIVETSAVLTLELALRQLS